MLVCFEDEDHCVFKGASKVRELNEQKIEEQNPIAKIEREREKSKVEETK